MHPVADLLAVAHAVLHERHVRRRDQVEVCRIARADGIDEVVAVACVALEPGAGGKGVGVADQQAAGLGGGLVFAALLFLRDVDELILRPRRNFAGGEVLARNLLFPVLTAIFRHPDGIVMRRELLTQRRLAGRLGADQDYAKWSAAVHCFRDFRQVRRPRTASARKTA